MVTLTMAFLFKVLIVLNFSFSAHAAITNKVVGKIENKVITARQVQMDTFLDRTLYNQNKRLYIPLDSKSFSIEVNRFFREWVVYLESKSFAFKVEPSKIDSARKQFLKTIKSSKYKAQWDRLGVSSSELKELVNRKVLAREFSSFKRNASLVPVTDTEAFNYYTNNKKKFGQQSYESIKDSLKKQLMQKQASERMSDWYQILLKKYKVQKVEV